MPLTTYSLTDLTTAVRAFFQGRFPNRDCGDESWLGKQARAIAMALLQIEKGIEDVDHDAVPSSKTSTGALDAFAVLFGLSSNLGGYGRNGAVAASGGAGPVTGVNGTVFSDGALLLASDGVTQFALSGAVTIPGVPPDSGTVAGSFVAVTKGVAGNLSLNAELTWISPPAGGDSVVSLSTSGASGGLDVETDRALLARIFDRLQRPPKGGAAVDYRTWAEATPGAGIARAYVYPLHGGLGTVHVVITAGGSGTARQPSNAAKTLVTAYVDDRRPSAMQDYQTVIPSMPGPNGLVIRARLKPSASKFRWDWDDTAATYLVDTYTPGSPATLKLDQLAPASLKAAIDANLKPRIQVEATDGPAVPVQIRVTAYADAGGKTTLTLEDPLPNDDDPWAPATAPVANDPVHAGGPLAAIAQDLLDYVDGLGPSRAAGTADEDDPWEDTCAVAQLTRIALDALDTDGLTRLASNVNAVVTIDGATDDVIGVGAVALAPELLFVALAIVTQ